MKYKHITLISLFLFLKLCVINSIIFPLDNILQELNSFLCSNNMNNVNQFIYICVVKYLNIYAVRKIDINYIESQ